jgi:transcriptional regulator with XRE-family HTH domain
MDKSFTTDLAAIRKAKGLTLVELSSKVGISHPALWNFENGKKSLREATLVKIAEALDVPFAAIAKRPLSPPAALRGADPNEKWEAPGLDAVRQFYAEMKDSLFADLRRELQADRIPRDRLLSEVLAELRALRAERALGTAAKRSLSKLPKPKGPR